MSNTVPTPPEEAHFDPDTRAPRERRLSFGNLALPILMFLVPLLGAPARLLHPAPWIGLVAGEIILLSQPPLGPQGMVKHRRDRFSGLGIYIAQILAPLIAIIDFGYRVEFHPAPFSLLVLAAFALVAGALTLRLWSIRTLGAFFTSTVRVQQGQTVVDSGPYCLLRHPSYTGALLTTLGISIGLASVVGVALTLLLGVPAYLYRIHVEEKALAEGLGDPYSAYCRRTWRLIPYVY